MEVRKISSFTDLLAWQEGHQIVLLIYKITKTFPKEEIYSLTDQMRRSAMSITNNIAEGFGRNTFKDKIHFYYLSFGSLNELQNQLIIAKDLKHLLLTDYEEISLRIDNESRLIQGLIKKSKTFI